MLIYELKKCSRQNSAKEDDASGKNPVARGAPILAGAMEYAGLIPPARS